MGGVAGSVVVGVAGYVVGCVAGSLPRGDIGSPDGSKILGSADHTDDCRRI